MNYHYCQFCFKKTAQGSDIVKFCAHCGKSFSEIASSSQTTKRPKPPSLETPREQERNDNREIYKKLLAKRGISVIDDDNEELETDDNDNDNDDGNYDDNISVPSITKLQLDIDIPQDTGIPVRSLARSAKREPRPNNKTKVVKVNKKKFLEEYCKSAAALRPKNK